MCTIGLWQRIDGGYRVLDWDAVEFCLDLVRQRRGEDPGALAQDRRHEARMWAQMAAPILGTPLCAACGSLAALIEHVAPGHLPAGWDQWLSTARAGIIRREPGRWDLLVTVPGGRGNRGMPLDPSRAR